MPSRSPVRTLLLILPLFLPSLLISTFRPQLLELDFGPFSPPWVLDVFLYISIAAAMLLALDTWGIFALVNELMLTVGRWWRGEGWIWAWGWNEWIGIDAYAHGFGGDGVGRGRGEVWQRQYGFYL